MLVDMKQSAQTIQLAMGTVMSHKVFSLDAEEVLAKGCHEISRLEGQLSRFIPRSEVSQINRSAGIWSESISPETLEVLTRSIEISQICKGAFDVTIGSLVDLWKIGKDSFAHPTDEQIEHALSLVDYHDLILDAEMMTARLNRVGQSIDLGGIAKGLAGDRITTMYKEMGISSAYSNLGGNVVTVGSKPDGSAWRIGIQDPLQQDRLIGCVEVTGLSVVTSGDYQRFTVGQNGNRYHHILSPISGRPTDSNLTSVTIVSESSITADVLSTVLFITGMEHGLEILNSFPETEAILMNAEEQIFVTRELEGRFQSADGIQYQVVKK